MNNDPRRDDAMEPAEIVSQTIERVRAAKNIEYRMDSNELPQQVVSLEDVADIVDAGLQEVCRALMEALDSEGQDEASEAERWWGGSEPEPGPYGIFFKGGLPEQGYLPREPTASSWWRDYS